jgi:Spy/CpxP family protein refolding chaperone
MKKHLLTVGLAVFAVATTCGVIIQLLTSRPAASTREDPEPDSPPLAFGDRTMNAQAGQGPPLGAPQPQPDPLGRDLFPPQMIMQFQTQIGLSNEQRQAIMADMQKAQLKLEQVQQRLQKEQAALSLLLGKVPVELEPALAQSDAVQDLEREMKRTHLALLIGMKNRLTSEQQAKLREIQAQQGPGPGAGAGPPRALHEKMQRLQAGIQQWQQSGRDPSPIGQAMRKFHPLIAAGQFEEAEAVLDDALELVAAGKKPR